MFTVLNICLAQPNGCFTHDNSGLNAKEFLNIFATPKINSKFPDFAQRTLSNIQLTTSFLRHIIAVFPERSNITIRQMLYTIIKQELGITNKSLHRINGVHTQPTTFRRADNGKERRRSQIYYDKHTSDKDVQYDAWSIKTLQI